MTPTRTFKLKLLYCCLICSLCICMYLSFLKLPSNDINYYHTNTKQPLEIDIIEGKIQDINTLVPYGKEHNIYSDSITHLCPRFHVYGFGEFALIMNVIINRAKILGDRKGGENIKDVMNQPEQMEYYKFKKGFYTLLCTGKHMCTNIHKNTFKWKHHLYEWFNAIHCIDNASKYKEIVSNVQNTENKLTVAVTRYEYANLFHAMTDWYNTFYITKVFNKKPSEIKILFIDGHPKSNLDKTWVTLFNSVEYLGDSVFNKTQFSQLAWNIVGYESMISKGLLNYGKCPEHIHDFSHFFLYAHNITKVHEQDQMALNIVFLWRRDYLAHPRQNRQGKSNETITRKISNEKEILQKTKESYSNHNIKGVQLDMLSMKRQLHIISKEKLFKLVYLFINYLNY